MKVAGTVVINLMPITDSRDAVSTARATIWAALSETPTGANVRLLVPRWAWWAPFAADALLDLGEHVGTVTVEGDADAVRRWVLALRRGSRHLHSVGER